MQGALSMVMYFFSGLFNSQAIVLRHGRRRLLIPRRQRRALSPRHLSDHRLGGLVSLPVFDSLR
jgi:hypothetical protein